MLKFCIWIPKRTLSTYVLLPDRSVLAEGCCRQLINESGLGDYVECESKVSFQENSTSLIDTRFVTVMVEFRKLHK